MVDSREKRAGLTQIASSLLQKHYLIYIMTSVFDRFSNIINRAQSPSRKEMRGA
jgi:hypothetical protein